MIRTFVVAAALFLATAAGAQTWQASYSFDSGGVLTFGAVGILQPDGNTVLVSSVFDSAINGTPTLPVSLIFSSFTGLPPEGFSPLLTLDGSNIDILACDPVSGLFGGQCFSATSSTFISGQAFFVADFGNNLFEPYNPANWSLTAPQSPSAIPEPASWAMLIAGFGLIGAVARRRRMATIAA